MGTASSKDRVIPRPSFRMGLPFVFGLIGFALSLTTTELPDTVIGIYIAPNGNTSFSPCLNGKTYTTDGTYAACCASTEANCNYATDCVGASMSMKDGDEGECRGSFPTCVTMTIFDKFPSATDSWLQYWCGNSDFKAHTLYREIAATTTSSTIQRSQSSQTADPASSTSIPEPSYISDNDSTPIESEESSSKAWIAGAVAGPLIALIALGAFAFWYRRRKQQTATTGGKYSPQLDEDDGYNQPYSVSDPPRYEDAGNPTSTSPGYELESVETRYQTPLLEAP